MDISTQNQPPSDLPKDLVSEILTRVSLQTLQQCRLASDEINTLTHLSYFMSLYCQRTNTFSGYIVQSFDRRGTYLDFIDCGTPKLIQTSLSLGFLPEKVRIEVLSHNEGLVYCVSSERSPGNYRYYVCKPTTREWVQIRNPKTRFETLANALVVTQTQPLRYVIVRFSKPIRQHVRDYKIFCEIFDSMTGYWRRANDIIFRKFVYLSKDPPIYAEGAMHWLTDTKEIFAFDVEGESWKLIPLPVEEELLTKFDDNKVRYSEKKLVQYEGKIALICFEHDHADLWVMENYTRQTWRKIAMVANTRAIDLYTSDAVILQEYEKLVLYNFQNQTFNPIDIGRFFCSYNIRSFKSDYNLVF